jgi:hypothetical protein
MLNRSYKKTIDFCFFFCVIINFKAMMRGNLMFYTNWISSQIIQTISSLLSKLLSSFLSNNGPYFCKIQSRSHQQQNKTNLTFVLRKYTREKGGQDQKQCYQVFIKKGKDNTCDKWWTDSRESSTLKKKWWKVVSANRTIGAAIV